MTWVKDREKRHQEFRKLIESSKRLSEDTKRTVLEIDHTLKRQKAEESARKRNAFFSRFFLGSTYRIRKRLGLLTLDEQWTQLEVERRFQELVEGIEQEMIRKIRRNEIRPLVLEGSGLKVFPVGPWKIVLVDGALDVTGSNDLLQKLAVLEKDEKGNLKRVMAAIGLSTNATHQARQALRDAGAKVVDESSEAKPQ